MEIINFNEDSKFVLDVQSKEIEININKCRVVISDITDSIKKINVNGGELDYCFIKSNNNLTSTNICVNRGKAEIRVIDILNQSSDNKYEFMLNKEDSELNFTLASIARYGVNKDYKIESNNNEKHTNVKIDCFGISENDSCIKYDITSFIKKGSKKSIVNQSSKILLFDKESKGINNPILMIEENDVKANHGSSIGMIDEETLFYLTSRGIDESVARNLVSLGKINYIIEEVKDEKIKEDLLKKVLERA